MTIAAQQCRIYIESMYPRTPISRKSCRNTASGSISQHSAYAVTESDPSGYDSNALDIFGPGKTATPPDQRWVQAIVDDLSRNLAAWSIRKIIWLTDARHQNHAHIDFYPMIREPKWCNRDITPRWRYSDGTTIDTRDPEPENGRYNGEEPPVVELTDEQWFATLRRQDITRLAFVGVITDDEAAYFNGPAVDPADMTNLRIAVQVRLPIWS